MAVPTAEPAPVAAIGTPLRETVKVVVLKTVTIKVPLVSRIGAASEESTVIVCPVRNPWAKVV